MGAKKDGRKGVTTFNGKKYVSENNFQRRCRYRREHRTRRAPAEAQQQLASEDAAQHSPRSA